MARARHRRPRRIFQQPVVPPWVPPAYVRHVPGRGEMFYRHHQGGEPGAPTLLLLHGWTASADLQWFTAYEALGERYPYVAMDVRGHGRGLRSEVPFTLEDAADDAAALVRELGLERVVVVGFSMGGPLSLLTAHRHPELVDGLVLAATALEFHSGFDRVQWFLLRLLESVFRSRTWRWVGRRALDRLERRHPEFQPWRAWVGAEFHRGDPTALAQAGRALRYYDARPWAAEIDKPAAVLVTTADRMVHPAKQWALAAALRAETAELSGDHFVFWERADAFSATLRKLVDGVVSRLDSAAAPRPAAATGARSPSPAG